MLEMIFGVIGGLGIFLLGMKNMSEGMQAVAGAKLRRLISAVTDNRLVACGVGTLITCLIQSSSITTVMVVGMVNARIMNLMQAIGVILGANIGTTITGWILVLKVGKYGLPMLGVASFFYLFSNRERVRYTAMLVLGLGMVFFGLELMNQGFTPIHKMPEFKEWFSRFQPDSYLGVMKCVLVGTVLTAIVQSSSATLGITMSLAFTGLIRYDTAAALVLGENIGTTITAYLASLGASRHAKRAAYAHIFINVSGVAWITLLFPFYMQILKFILGHDPAAATISDGVETYPHAMKLIAMSHTGFNVVNVIVLMPLLTPIAKFLYILVPNLAHKEKPHLTYLDVRMVETPAIGIQQSWNEILRMAETTDRMMGALHGVLTRSESNKSQERKIFSRESNLDIVQKEVVQFLSHLLSGNVPHEVMENGRRQLRMADEYESVSDYITNILKLHLKLDNNDLQMSDTGRQEILDLHQQVWDYLRMVNTGVREENREILWKAHTRGDAITHLMKDYRASHLMRVEKGQASPLKSLIFTDMLNAYRRIKDHALNIAEVLSGEK